MNLYNRLVTKANTINLQNLLHIRLENWLTPEKFHMIRQSKALKANSSTMEWLKKLSAMFNMAGKNHVETFERFRLNKNICLYTDNSSGLSKSEKKLVLCMTGTLQRMMMPLPVFLQHFDAKSTDIVLIRYPKGHGYANGILGIADDFDNAIDIVAHLIDSNSYAKKVAFGASAGALPALMAALKLSFDAVISAGAGSPYHERWAKVESETYASSFIKNHANSLSKPKIYLVYGKDDPADAKSANDIASLIPSKKMVISSPDQPIRHVCLPVLVNSGKFTNFLNETIFAN